MFNIFRLLAVISAVLLLAPASYAASNVAVVNIQKIMRDSKAANTIRAQVKTKQKSFQEELDRKETMLQQEDQELAKQRNVLSQEAFQKKYAEFREKAVAAQKEVRVKRARLDKGLAQALADIQKKVTDIVAEVAKQNGYDLVVSGNLVLYTADKNDITEQVLSQLDRELPNVNVNFN